MGIPLLFLQEKLLSKPLSLLNDQKLSLIYKTLDRHKIKNFLEIGTWVGGSIHLLSKYSPQTKFDTVDINDFRQMYKSNMSLVSVLESQIGSKLNWRDLKNLQNFYRNNSPNVNFYDAGSFDWSGKDYDAVLIDGDHSQIGVRRDLLNAYDHMSRGFVFIDDTSYFHIRLEVQTFCYARKLKFKYFPTVPRQDFALIRINKDGEKRKPKFPKHIKKLHK